MKITTGTGKLTGDDLVWLYGATKEALEAVNDIGRKTRAEVDGEVFTTLRRLANETGSLRMKEIFRGSKKQYPWRLDARITRQEREIIITMYDQLKRRRMAEHSESDATVRDLEVIVLAAKASANEAAHIAQRAEQVRKGLDGIQDILDGRADG